MRERHGKRYSRVYRAWLHMKNRCLNPRNNSFAYYGGRGITICDKWRDSFVAFYEDMGDPPAKHSLDRIDNNGNYSPNNCRWASKRQQANNTRANHCITFNGITKTLMQWQRVTGISRFVIADRIYRGWPIKKALTEPVAHSPQRRITFNGKTQNLSAWARETGLSVAVLHGRLKRGWSVKDALTTHPGGRYNYITFDGKTQTVSAWSRETGLGRATIRNRVKRGLPLEQVLAS